MEHLMMVWRKSPYFSEGMDSPVRLSEDNTDVLNRSEYN